MYVQLTFEEDQARLLVELLDSAMRNDLDSNSRQFSDAKQAKFILERSIERAEEWQNF
jgi:hypothetical protein